MGKTKQLFEEHQERLDSIRVHLQDCIINGAMSTKEAMQEWESVGGYEYMNLQEVEDIQ